MSIRYWIGGLLRNAGWTAKPTWKEPQCTLNLVEVAVSALSRQGEFPIVVQVGAYDGQANDPLGDWLKTGRFQAAYLIEPQPAPAAILRSKYAGDSRVHVVEAAITDRDGPVPMYSPSASDQRASLSPEHGQRFAVKHLHAITVEGLTPATFLQRYKIESIDLLQIDCEGYDLRVLKLFLEQHRPRIINYEHFHLTRSEREEGRRLLTDLDYQYLESGFDTFCVHSEWFASSHGRV